MMHPDTFAKISEMEVNMDDPRQVAFACLLFAAFLNEAIGEQDQQDAHKYLQMLSDLGGIALMYLDAMSEMEQVFTGGELDLTRANVGFSA